MVQLIVRKKREGHSAWRVFWLGATCRMTRGPGSRLARGPGARAGCGWGLLRASFPASTVRDKTFERRPVVSSAVVP